MPFCGYCGNELEANARFCSCCGSPVEKKTGEVFPERKQEYLGTVIKCPSCGAEVPSLTAVCPECGHEFNSVEIPNSLEQFIREINSYDLILAAEPKEAKGWQTWTSGGKFWWIFLNICTVGIPALIRLVCPLIAVLKKPVISETAQKKALLIQNLPIPNERKTILNTLRYIQSKISGISFDSPTNMDRYWAKIWKKKADEIICQAKFVLPDDSKVTAISAEIKRACLKIRRKVIWKVIGFFVIIFVLILFLSLFSEDEPTIS